MDRVRTALYLDFDNVFSGLYKLDPDAAIAFGEAPGVLLDRLSTTSTIDGPRAWLVRRCYMNPNGSIPQSSPDASGSRLYFSRFRPYFTRAGFDVIDCPALTQGTKNAADIRMVLDAMDAMTGATHYDEFVIASGDSDLTPLLVRLRAADRRTTIVSPFDAAEAFTSIADLLIDGQRTLELLQDEPEADLPVDGRTPVSQEKEVAALHRKFGELVRARYEKADRPLHLGSLAQEVQGEFGPVVIESAWFGHGSFGQAVRHLDLTGLVMAQQWVWDGDRHEAPPTVTAVLHVPGQPEAVGRLCALLNLPRLPQSVWPPLYSVLSDYASSHTFSLTEATAWSRSQLAQRGVQVNRKSIGFVVQGANYGGCPLYGDPSPRADQIATAFVSNLLSRASAAQIDLSARDISGITAWLGVPALAPGPR